MKKFLISILVFFFVALAFAFGLDVLISHYLRQSKTYAAGEYSVWNDIYNGNINSDIIIQGSSRAVVQIDPMLIQQESGETCYNLGVDGNNIGMEYFRYQQFLQHNAKPRLIIHSLDIFMLTDATDIFNSEQFLPYMLWNNEIKDRYQHNDYFSFLDFYVPLIRYQGNTVAILHAFKLMIRPHSETQGRTRGYEAQNLEWNSDLNNAKQKMESFVAPIDRNALQLFEQYIRECRAQNIELIFVYTPEYIEGQKFVKNRTEVLDLYQRLRSKYNITYYDYSGDSMCLDKSYFYNSGHLNKRGSEKFTKILVSDLKIKK